MISDFKDIGEASHVESLADFSDSSATADARLVLFVRGLIGVG
jgi:hypothetical protein